MHFHHIGAYFGQTASLCQDVLKSYTQNAQLAQDTVFNLIRPKKCLQMTRYLLSQPIFAVFWGIGTQSYAFLLYWSTFWPKGITVLVCAQKLYHKRPQLALDTVFGLLRPKNALKLPDMFSPSPFLRYFVVQGPCPMHFYHIGAYFDHRASICYNVLKSYTKSSLKIK